MKSESLQKLTDKQLFLLVVEGNRVAFNHFYNRFWKGLFAYSLNILNDPTLAEDIIHEVFIKLWTNRENLDVSNPNSYLFVAVKNKSLSQLRKAKLTELDESTMRDLETPAEIGHKLDEEDLKMTIERAVESLPEKRRVIFYMSRYQDYSNAEIANHFKISHRTVENQLSLALKHIRTVLGNLLYFLVFFL